MAQDTGKFRTNTKDQFYTKSSVASACVSKIFELFPESTAYEWIEPSAGNGVFLNCLPAEIEKLGIDLQPNAAGIQKGNFLEWRPTTHKKRVIFGNPPFGKQSSLAKSFIKHASTYADIIAFILPRSFVKVSMSKAFPLEFHCRYSQELQKNAFEVNAVSYDVPCVFQIWEKREENRVVADPVKEVGFEYVKAGEAFHIAFKRVGGLAGQCLPQGGTYNPQCFYFLKLQEKYIPHIQEIIETVSAHVFPSNTVGPRSLSKSETNEVLNQILQGYP
jgi:hypothetical protein